VRVVVVVGTLGWVARDDLRRDDIRSFTVGWASFSVSLREHERGVVDHGIMAG
jgi:hypothetical protein